MPSYKLTKVTIKDYKGITSLAFSVGAGGAIISGPNGAGKTSARDAVLATLVASGVDPSCIRDGADSSEILVDLDGARVRRTINHKGTGGVTVKNEEGDTWGKTQTRLNALFGEMLDPLRFFNADKKEQRRMLLEACPEIPTAEDFARWLGKMSSETIPNVDGLSGLEAVERVRKAYYERRKQANKEADAAKEKADKAAAMAKAAREAIPQDADKLPAVDVVQSRLEQAKREHADLVSRDKQAREQSERSQGTRERIANLRAEVERLDNESQNGPTPEEMEKARGAVSASSADVDRLSRELKAAVAINNEMIQRLAALQSSDADAHAADREAIKVRAQADDLEASLTAVAIPRVPPEDLARAEEMIIEQTGDLQIAKEGARVVELEHDAATAKAKADEAQSYASELDAVVSNLTNVAPRELMSRSNGIPGIALTDEGISLDGRNLANLCGQEQMALSIEIAKRVNKGAGKLLCVDGLEALDENNRVKFIELATSDGWQLIGTLVSGSDLHIIEIE